MVVETTRNNFTYPPPPPHSNRVSATLVYPLKSTTRLTHAVLFFPKKSFPDNDRPAPPPPLDNFVGRKIFRTNMFNCFPCLFFQIFLYKVICPKTSYRSKGVVSRLVISASVWVFILPLYALPSCSKFSA